MLGVLFALVALLLGWATCRGLRVDLAIAPAAGLALMAIVTSWGLAAGTPLTPVLVMAIGLATAMAVALHRTDHPKPTRRQLWTLALLVLAAVLPALLLGVAFAGLGAPVSNHDGAFHVETIDALRRGVHFDTWYPRGYHAAIAAVLGLAPWVDSARGTTEASEGLTILAPLAVFGLARRLGASPRVAAVAALIQALTFIYPYDFHLWGGWPLGMGVVLALGVWTAALGWIANPSARSAALVGLLSGAILLTHGTEVYTASLGLLVIVLARWQRLDWRRLAIHLPLAAGATVIVALPYLPPLVAWARGGGAVSAALSGMESTVLDPELQGLGLWLQVGMGAVGASSFVDLPLRVALIAVALRQPGARLAASLWLVVVGWVVLFAFVSHPLVDRVFALTYPWLADQRLLQVTSIFASILAAGGLDASLGRLARLRAGLAIDRPRAARRLAIAAALAFGFLVEGSGVNIYKRLAQASDSSYTRDDSRAMGWLRQQARPGEALANDSSVDAGIWAPYKAGVPIVQPRSGSGVETLQRQLVLDNIADLPAAPLAEAEACRLGLRYVYYGARLYAYEAHAFPSPAVLERAPGLVEAFRSGDAVIFQTQLSCP
jgi:hypothetical protein